MSKLFTQKSILFLSALYSAALLVIASFAQAADEPTCPYADDAVILYCSPVSVAKAGCAMNNKYGFKEEIACVERALDKADLELQKLRDKNDANFPAEQYDYFTKALRDVTGQASTIRALICAFYTYVDGVVVALELPEFDGSSNYAQKACEGLSLSLIFNAKPSILDPRKIVPKRDEIQLEITSEETDLTTGKLTLSNSGKKAVVYFGGVKIKDVDKYAIVFGSKSNVAKKIDRFQKSNEFIVKRLDDSGLIDERILKTQVFETIVKAINDEEAKRDRKLDDRMIAIRGVVENLKSLRFTIKADENGLKEDLNVETANEEAAQNYVDLAVGAVALAKLGAQKKDNLKEEEKFGLELLDGVNIVRDDVNFKADASISTEQLRKIFWLVKSKIDK